MVLPPEVKTSEPLEDASPRKLPEAGPPRLARRPNDPLALGDRPDTALVRGRVATPLRVRVRMSIPP